MADCVVRPVREGDREWLRQQVEERLGGEPVVTPYAVYEVADALGFAAEKGGELCGFATYAARGGECELTALLSLAEGERVGTALVGAVRAAADCARLWVTTTNDSMNALTFYQKRGFALCALRRDAMARVRRHKPRVPSSGREGIPRRDMLELEMPLGTTWKEGSRQ